MKKRYIGFIAAVFLVLIGTSCEDEWLAVQPRDIISEDKAFQSLEDIEAGVIGVYAAFTVDPLVDVSSRMGDDLRLGDGNRGQGRQTHDWAFNSGTGEALGYWSNFYGDIAIANRVINNIERLLSEGVVTEAEVNDYKGEMLGLRAFAHFVIWQLYGGYESSDLAVPYLTLADNDGNGLPDGIDIGIKPARLTTSEFFTLLFDDLNEAESLLPDENENIFRMSKDAVIALKARANLFRGNYTDAVSQAESLISKYELASITNFPSVWTDQSRQGIIFAVRRIPGDGRIGTLFEDLNGDRFFQPSFEVYELFSANDIRSSAYFADNGNSVNKYPGTEANPFLSDQKVFRVEEMYLISAEANARENNLTAAAERLNQLRAQRITGYVDEPFPSINPLIDAILVEKRKELVYEGHRLFDLKRLEQDMERDPRDCESGAIPCEVLASDYRWLFPIPQAEIFANDNIVQNDGYTTETE